MIVGGVGVDSDSLPHATNARMSTALTITNPSQTAYFIHIAWWYLPFSRANGAAWGLRALVRAQP